MRHAGSEWALWLVLMLCTPAFAQPGAERRFVKGDAAEVRSGPSLSAQFYVTNRLARGTSVEVLAELPDGWLKITPPAGSFSWINTRFLEHIDPRYPNHVVTLEGAEVPVYIGTEFITDRRPGVTGAKLKRGAQVASVGKTYADSEGTWMPIEAPAGEVRYIRASDVERNPTANTGILQASTSGASPAATVPAGGSLQRSDAPSANAQPNAEQLCKQAIAADKAGKTDEAIRLYCLVAAEARRTNPLMASQALARAHWLEHGHQTYGAVKPMTQQAVTASTTALSGPTTSVPIVPVRLSPPAGSVPANAPFTTTTVNTTTLSRLPPAGQQSFVGRLVPAGRVFTNTKTYRLESVKPGVRMPLTYIIAGRPDMNLEAYVNRVVEVWGPGKYHGDVRGNLLHAMTVFPQE